MSRAFEPLFLFNEQFASVSALCFSNIRQRECLVVGSADGDVSVWDLFTFHVICKMKAAHCREVVALYASALNSNQFQFISHGREGAINGYKLLNESEVNFEIIPLMRCSSLSFCSFSVLEENGFLIVAIPDENSTKTVTLFTINSDDKSTIINRVDTNYTVSAFKISRQEITTYLFIGCDSGTLLLYSTKKEELNFKFNNEIKSIIESECCFITCIDYDSHRNIGICGSSSKFVVLFSLKTDSETPEFEIKQKVLICEGIASISIRDDKKIVAFGCWDHKIRVMKWPSLKILAISDIHRGTVNRVTFSHPQKGTSKYLLAAGSADQTVTLWDPFNKEITCSDINYFKN